MPSGEIIVNDGNVVQSQNADHGGEQKSAVMHRSLNKSPMRVVAAKGHYLTMAHGQQVFDATGGAAVACLGHGNEEVANAIADQTKEVSYCHSLFFTTSASEDLAKMLIEGTNGEMARAFFISSGSEAMEAALKLARQYHLEKMPSEPQRTHFIARQQSYHGTTLGALAVGGHVARRALFEPLLSVNSSRVSPCYAYRATGEPGIKDPSSTNGHAPSYVSQLEAELDAEFQRVGPSNVAAFIAEPVVGAALGCVPAVPGYFPAVRRICDKYGALLILDEVMCGAGRVGPEPSARFPNPVHAWQDPLIDVVPDIMTMGKGLGGGYVPVAAMLARRSVIDVLHAGTGAFSHGQTYQGHPLSCRAALAVQKIISEKGLIANVRKQGKVLGELLKKRLSSHPSVGDIRGKGLFWGIEFVADKTTKEPFESQRGVAMGVHELGMQPPHSISLYPGTGSADGHRGDHILIAPAYTVTEAEIGEIVDKTAAVIEQFFTETRTNG